MRGSEIKCVYRYRGGLTAGITSDNADGVAASRAFMMPYRTDRRGRVTASAAAAESLTAAADAVTSPLKDCIAAVDAKLAKYSSKGGGGFTSSTSTGRGHGRFGDGGTGGPNRGLGQLDIPGSGGGAAAASTAALAGDRAYSLTEEGHNNNIGFGLGGSGHHHPPDYVTAGKEARERLVEGLQRHVESCIVTRETHLKSLLGTVGGEQAEFLTRYRLGLDELQVLVTLPLSPPPLSSSFSLSSSLSSSSLPSSSFPPLSLLLLLSSSSSSSFLFACLN